MEIIKNIFWYVLGLVEIYVFIYLFVKLFKFIFKRNNNDNSPLSTYVAGVNYHCTDKDIVYDNDGVDDDMEGTPTEFDCYTLFDKTNQYNSKAIKIMRSSDNKFIGYVPDSELKNYYKKFGKHDHLYCEVLLEWSYKDNSKLHGDLTIYNKKVG